MICAKFKLVKWLWRRKFLNFVNVFVRSPSKDVKYLCTGVLYILGFYSAYPLLVFSRFRVENWCTRPVPSGILARGGGGSPDLTSHQLYPYKKSRSSGQYMYIISKHISVYQVYIIASAASSNDNACVEKRVTWLAHSSTINLCVVFLQTPIMLRGNKISCSRDLGKGI